MKETSAWVAPMETLPVSLSPIAAMQKKHFGAVLNPTRWWGRMPRLFLAGGAVCRLPGAAQGAFDPGSAIATNDAGLAGLPLRILY
ncbi:FIG00922551: hypothetical protein [Enterobacter hormaechei]|nr:FIG00922551: hypothetical protein [Enterobacter hormaechei]